MPSFHRPGDAMGRPVIASAPPPSRRPRSSAMAVGSAASRSRSRQSSGRRRVPAHRRTRTRGTPRRTRRRALGRARRPDRPPRGRRRPRGARVSDPSSSDADSKRTSARSGLRPVRKSRKKKRSRVASPSGPERGGDDEPALDDLLRRPVGQRSTRGTGEGGQQQRRQQTVRRTGAPARTERHGGRSARSGELAEHAPQASRGSRAWPARSPRRMAGPRSTPTSAPNPLSMITAGSRARVCPMAAASSSPFISGIARSVTTTSNRAALEAPQALAAVRGGLDDVTVALQALAR